MSGIDEHADGELGDVPTATDATPGVFTGNVARLRRSCDKRTMPRHRESCALWRGIGRFDH